LFKVTHGEVEIVKSPFQAIPLETAGEKIHQIYADAISVPHFTWQTVPPLRSDTVPPLKSTNRDFPSDGLV